MISSAIGGFAIVVLVFWSYNINSVKKAVDKWLDNLKVKDLLEVPKQIDNNKKTVTRMSIVFQLLFTIIFGLAFIILFNKYGAFGFYQGDLLLEPIFNDGLRSLTLILIISIFILSINYYIIYLIKGSKTTALLVFDTFNALLALGTLTYFLTFPYLINNEFIVVIANNFNMTNERISGIINSNLNITLITTVSVVLIVYIISWVRHLKNRI